MTYTMSSVGKIVRRYDSKSRLCSKVKRASMNDTCLRMLYLLPYLSANVDGEVLNGTSRPNSSRPSCPTLYRNGSRQSGECKEDQDVLTHVRAAP